jgi:hypothetical protein
MKILTYESVFSCEDRCLKYNNRSIKTLVLELHGNNDGSSIESVIYIYIYTAALVKQNGE